MSFRTAAALAGLLIAALSPALARAEHLTLERVYSSPDLSGPRAREVKLAPDGALVTYLKAKTENREITDLWAVSTHGGAPYRLIDAGPLIPKDVALSEAEKSRRERQGVQTHGVVAYDWDEQRRFILVPVEGDLWLFTLKGRKLSRLTQTPGDEIDAKVSPKGGFVSYVREDNLYVTPSGGGAERALTTDGVETKSWATAEFIAEEELDRDTGYWWSPDEKRIALTHVDTTGVDIVPRVDVGAHGATVVEQRYPRVGRPNAVVDLYVEDTASGARVKVDLGSNPDIYLARVDWAKDGSVLYVQRLTRDQKRLDILAVNPATGASRVILSETSPHWIETTDDLRPLKTGGFLWSSERSGYRHLYLYAADGTLVRQVTSGDWPVDAVAGVDEATGRVIFSAAKDEPIERRIYAASYRKPGAPTALTSAGGWWSATVAANGVFVGTYEDPLTPPRTGVYGRDGKFAGWIEENRLASGHPFYPYAADLRAPAFGTIKAADGEDLWWKMRTPPGFDPAKRYPVIVETYGGPTGQEVRRNWNAPANQLYLDAGFILFTLDNRGSANRSVRFKTALDRHLGGVEVDDQIAGANYLKTLPYVDGARIGITGGSYGGYMTLMLLTAPGTPFAAGVSDAPPTDWTLYDTAYTERYMGTPADNVAGYAASEVTARLGGLKPWSLMLMHGMADDNVIFENSTRLMAALQAKAIPFEMMTYPGLRHRAGWGLPQRQQREAVTLDFFERRLGVTPAP